MEKSAFIGDSSPVEDATPKYVREDSGQTKKTYDGYKEENDAILLENIVNWLSNKETFTSLDQVNGLQLDSPTALQTFEQPSLSTEPQPEPWVHQMQVINGLIQILSNQVHTVIMVR